MYFKKQIILNAVFKLIQKYFYLFIKKEKKGEGLTETFAKTTFVFIQIRCTNFLRNVYCLLDLVHFCQMHAN